MAILFANHYHDWMCLSLLVDESFSLTSCELVLLDGLNVDGRSYHRVWNPVTCRCMILGIAERNWKKVYSLHSRKQPLPFKTKRSHNLAVYLTEWWVVASPSWTLSRFILHSALPRFFSRDEPPCFLWTPFGIFFRAGKVSLCSGHVGWSVHVTFSQRASLTHIHPY